MLRNRVAPDPALNEVVRDRLAVLLAEVPARRALGAAPDEEAETLPDELSPLGAPLVVPVAPDVGAGEGDHAAAIRLPVVAGWGRAAWEFSRSHLLAVGIVLLTGCLWAGYNVLQARSSPIDAPPAAVVPTVSSSPSPTPTVAPVLVHVLGAVVRPGVVRLPQGARVQDAIEAAGGLTADADPGELNLAAVVADGCQVMVGDRTSPRGELREAGGGAPLPGGEGKLSLNTATQAQLEALPGVGPVTAQKILSWREQHGKFTRVEELQEIDGIGPKTYGELAPHVSL